MIYSVSFLLGLLVAVPIAALAVPIAKGKITNIKPRLEFPTPGGDFRIANPANGQLTAGGDFKLIADDSPGNVTEVRTIEIPTGKGGFEVVPAKEVKTPGGDY
ncbi:MAG: hypothetical protein M1829_004713 [Trizodia sp. TS-e1964]|nr:MAG: hypothetical protein M1829_004713 [Trizodia sp. TS-e1964]